MILNAFTREQIHQWLAQKQKVERQNQIWNVIGIYGNLKS